MTSDTYPYIDIAALDAVRARFAAGDGLVVLSPDLEIIIWANGPGARSWGYSEFDTVAGDASGLSTVARRQISALSGFPHIGSNRGVSVRLASGHSSRAVGIAASELKLPDGAPAILLAMPSAALGRDAAAVAARAISGFSQTGHFAAILDAEGGILAASQGFRDLALESVALEDLVREVHGQTDRLIKRPVAAGSGALPAGIARLTDDPAHHLLVVVDEPLAAAGEDDAETGETPSPATVPADETPVDHPELAATGKEGGKSVAADAEVAQEEDDDGRTETVAPPQPAPDPSAGPIRFVWKTDAVGRFSELSQGFASAVGMNSMDIVGRDFTDVAVRLGLDPDGEIGGLLERRDTWSGRSVLWPIAGTDLRVPVDLAALPAYGRDRGFEGFRGFGVARMGDAVVDGEATGLHLVAPDLPAESEPVGKKLK